MTSRVKEKLLVIIKMNYKLYCDMQRNLKIKATKQNRHISHEQTKNKKTQEHAAAANEVRSNNTGPEIVPDNAPDDIFRTVVRVTGQRHICRPEITLMMRPAQRLKRERRTERVSIRKEINSVHNKNVLYLDLDTYVILQNEKLEPERKKQRSGIQIKGNARLTSPEAAGARKFHPHLLA